MNRKTIGMLLAVGIGLGITQYSFSEGASAPQPASQTKQPVYTFFEFTSQLKNMHMHGLILDQKSGRAWVVITVGDNEAFVARPVNFESYELLDIDPETRDVKKMPLYTPAEAESLKTQLEQGNLKRLVNDLKIPVEKPSTRTTP